MYRKLSMNTSYFGSPKLLKVNNKLISISKQPPNWFHSPHEIYKPLCPSWQLVSSYKVGEISKEEYTKYYNEFLDNLDPARTYQELGEDSILLCWEKTGFCHRFIVADWFLKHLKIEVKEL